MLLAACDDARPLGPDNAPAYASSAKKLGPEICAFGQNFTLNSTNTYFPLTVGSWWELSGEEDGAEINLRIDVLRRTETVGGVRTLVLKETEYVDGALQEESWNYFAETANGTVCYFGEAVNIYENGTVSHEGAWRADDPNNSPGIFMPADPRPGVSFVMEGAPDVAEDEGTIVSISSATVPAGFFANVLRVREFNPLDAGKDYKLYAAGVGLIIDGPLSLDAYHIQ